MSGLDPISAILEGMRTSLANGFPQRIVADELLDFADREESELQQGVYTLLSDGQPSTEEFAETIGVMFVGQVMVAEKAGNRAVELAENEMIAELKRLRQAANVNIQIGSIQQSRRLEAPYGWIRADLTVGPFDFTPQLPDALTDPFELFHADWDIRPFTSQEDHEKWADEDHESADEQPDAQDDVQLEQES